MPRPSKVWSSQWIGLDFVEGSGGFLGLFLDKQKKGGLRSCSVGLGLKQCVNVSMGFFVANVLSRFSSSEGWDWIRFCWVHFDFVNFFKSKRYEIDAGRLLL